MIELNKVTGDNEMFFNYDAIAKITKYGDSKSQPTSVGVANGKVYLIQCKSIDTKAVLGDSVKMFPTITITAATLSTKETDGLVIIEPIKLLTYDPDTVNGSEVVAFKVRKFLHKDIADVVINTLIQAYIKMANDDYMYTLRMDWDADYINLMAIKCIDLEEDSDINNDLMFAEERGSVNIEFTTKGYTMGQLTTIIFGLLVYAFANMDTECFNGEFMTDSLESKCNVVTCISELAERDPIVSEAYGKVNDMLKLFFKESGIFNTQ